MAVHCRQLQWLYANIKNFLFLLAVLFPALNYIILDKNWQNSPSALRLDLPLLNDEEIFKKITTVLPTGQDDFHSETTTFKPFNLKRKAT